jgi:hypothetical protein
MGHPYGDQSSPVQIKASQNLGSSKRVLVNKAKNIIHDSKQYNQMSPHEKWNFNPHEMLLKILKGMHNPHQI